MPLVYPERARARRWYDSKGTPFTVKSGLGVVSVSGRMRSPRPAANKIILESCKEISNKLMKKFNQFPSVN
jgi:hypothetical protein